jgi:ketosteroid isomerase-like protein
MSQENVEIVRRIYDLFAGNWAGGDSWEASLPDFADPDIHIDMTRRVINPASYDGYEGIRRVREEVREVWEEWSTRAERLIDAGDSVVVIETQRGRGANSGLEVAGDRWASIWELRDGRITLFSGYHPVEEALEAVGLREEPPAP